MKIRLLVLLFPVDVSLDLESKDPYAMYLHPRRRLTVDRHEWNTAFLMLLLPAWDL